MEIKITKRNKYADSKLFREETDYSYFVRDEEYFLSGDATEQELLNAFAAHNPITPTEPTVQEKLASVGLSLDELKAAILGGN